MKYWETKNQIEEMEEQVYMIKNNEIRKELLDYLAHAKQFCDNHNYVHYFARTKKYLYKYTDYHKIIQLTTLKTLYVEFIGYMGPNKTIYHAIVECHMEMINEAINKIIKDELFDIAFE